MLHRLYDDFGGRIRFVTLYGREAHPGERFPQPATLERKLEHAERYVLRDHIRWTVAVDDPDGSLHRALDRKPHAAYLVRPDGRVAARFLWANHEAPLRRALVALLDDPGADLGTREHQVVPMLRGLGSTHETLASAGDRALEDMRRAAPPVLALAWLARRFEPLPPLGRGVLAAGLATLGTLGLAAAIAGAVRSARCGRLRRPDPP